MADIDPFATQRDVTGSVVAELADVGFADACEIGRGGFGIVYKCRQTSLDRTVAVKVLTADLDEDNRARFRREQRAAGRLTGHPNVVNILHVGVTENDRPYIVMPFYPGSSLDERIRERGPLALEEALWVGVKLVGALKSAHSLGIVHRDVKPANILLTENGEPALTDFGIAHIAGAFETATGIVTGSPAFTAPEVIAGSPPSPAADIYGIGATLFAAVTGHAAFERRKGELLVAHFIRISNESQPDPREHGVADDVSALIESAMASEPELRPSAAELERQLRRAQVANGFVGEAMTHRASLSSDQVGIFAQDPAMAPIDDHLHDEASRGSSGSSGRTGALPLELTSFVDRRIESAEVKNRLSTARLVTLTGMGGVGKTRLAFRIASQARSEFADGVYLVELGELGAESLLVNVVADAVGMHGRSARPPLEMLKDFLAPRDLLLVLDNCEHVLDSVAKLTSALLRTSPRLRILATSREPLGIGGEVALLIPPLAVPDPDRLPRRLPRDDAVTLFVERGATALPGFEITDDNRVTVARICQRLDGLPLAIELAAARLSTLAPESILARLADRYALLTHGRRDVPSRQQTLRMCIGWSYDLCTPAEQKMWARLSVFAGSFELEAAEQVCERGQPERDFLDTITGLVEKSILIREPGPVTRYWMLETVREFGHEKAEASDEYPALRRGYRDWYEQLARDAEADWIGPRQLEWISRLVVEQPNLRQALDFCVTDDPEAGFRTAGALFPFWLARGLFSEGRLWIDRLLARAVSTAGIDRAKMTCVASIMAGLQGDLMTAATLVEQGRVLASKSSDTMLRAHIDLADGYQAQFSGELRSAQTYFEEAAQVYAAERGAILFHILALDGLGITFDLLGQTDRAVECYELALGITEAHGEDVHRSYTLWALAVVLWREHNTARAAGLLRQSIQIGRRFNDRLSISICLEALAWIASEDHDAERAVVLASSAEKLSQSMGSPTIFQPGLLNYHNEIQRQSRRTLNDKTRESALRKGRAFGVAEAVAYALRETLPADSKRDMLSSPALTKRELEVAELVAEGLTNREISARLTISPRTAQGHVEHILTKLGLTSRTQIAVWVVELRKGNS